MQKNDLFVGLDIGSSEIRCVVGASDEAEGGNAISVLGVGSSPVSGMRKGVIIHPEEVSQAVNSALEEAERVVGKPISAATININGSHVESQISRGVIAISNQDHIITNDDRLRAEDAATIMQMPPNREIIQLFAKNYLVDGQTGIKDPVGMQGVRLEVDALIMTGSTPILRTVDSLLSNMKLRVNHRTTSSLAAAEAVLSRANRESGSAVIDIGAGTTNIVIMDEGEVEHVSVIPVGSMNITNDLAIGLKIELELAEKIKTDYVDLTESQKGTKSLTIAGEAVTFSLEDVDMIVRARLEELSELIDKELKRAGYSRKLPGGVVITGGGSKLPGIAEFFKDSLELPAKLGRLQGLGGLADSVDRPEYHTAAGLMVLDMFLSGVDDSHARGSQLDGIGSKLKGMFKRS